MRKLILILICAVLFCGCSHNNTPSVTASDITVEQTSKDKNEEYLSRYLDSFLDSGYELPQVTEDEVEVIWSVDEGNAYIEEGKLYKNNNAQEYEPIVLSAQVNDKTYKFDNLMLLDEYVGYLMTYFSGEGTDAEKMKLAFTYNGEFWYVINGQKPVLEATIGTKRLRDPSLLRNKDGSFTILATEGYDNPSIYMFDTKDFVTYENERLVQLNVSSNSLTMSEKQAWAPEGFYDYRIDKYFIYWSSPSDGGMYYNYSSDLNDVSYPQKLLDCGFTVIDGTIIKLDSHYGIVLKDEREPMEEYSQLFIGTSDSDYLNFDTFDTTYITGHQMEGPFMVKGDYSYILYYDDYTRSQFKASRFYELESKSFEVVPDTDLMFPMENVKHGYAIPLTFKELERILNEYGSI